MRWNFFFFFFVYFLSPQTFFFYAALKSVLCSIFIVMPSFLFNTGLPLNFLLQCLLEWDFRGRPPPTTSAEFISF